MKLNPFIVTCAGMSGSKWLASSLNKHPAISCSHSAGLHTIYERNYSDNEIIDILDIERAQFSGEILLSDIFTNILQNETRLSGNVHAFRLYRLKEAIQKDRDTPIFKIANLVRHPLDVTLSRAAMFQQMCLNDKTVRTRVTQSFEENKELYQELVKKYRLDIEDYSILSFLDAALGMKKLSDEIQNNPDVYHIKIEDLKDATNFQKLIIYLSDGAIQTTTKEAEKIVASPIINSHNKSKKKKHQEKYTNLSPWKKEAIKIGFRECDIITQYKKLNYDFNFLEIKDESSD
jgi:hypothetical protein